MANPTILAGNSIANGVLYGPEQFRELILEPTITSPDLAQILTIRDGTKAKEDILFVKGLSKITKLDTGCGTVPNTPGMDVEKLTWDPVALESWLAECAADFDRTFLSWGLANGYDKYDLQKAVIKIKNGTATSDAQTMNYWNEFVQESMELALRNDIFRIGFFGDPAITAAQLTLASDVTNYNQLRGLWPQIIALATQYASVRAYTIQANQAGAGSQMLPDGEATKIFTSLVFGAGIDQRLRSGDFGTPIILCTQSVADNWALERQSKNLDTSFKLMETGLVGPRYNNLEIIPRPEWDRIIAADFNKSGVLNLPHRAVLTTKENLQLGFDSYDAATNVDSWYNKETKYTHMRGNWKMDAKVMRPFLLRAAF